MTATMITLIIAATVTNMVIILIQVPSRVIFPKQSTQTAHKRKAGPPRKPDQLFQHRKFPERSQKARFQISYPKGQSLCCRVCFSGKLPNELYWLSVTVTQKRIRHTPQLQHKRVRKKQSTKTPKKKTIVLGLLGSLSPKTLGPLTPSGSG